MASRFAAFRSVYPRACPTDTPGTLRVYVDQAAVAAKLATALPAHLPADMDLAALLYGFAFPAGTHAVAGVSLVRGACDFRPAPLIGGGQ